MSASLPAGIHFDRDLDGVDWEELASVVERAPLGRRDPGVLERSFRGSTHAVLIREDDRLVGAGRALSDGELWVVLYDLVLLPELQGRGLGRALVDHLVQASGARNAMLYHARGKDGLYAHLGFRPMRSAMARFADPDSARANGHID